MVIYFCVLNDAGAFNWTWLTKTRQGLLVVRNTNNAVDPLRLGAKALLVCDV